MKIKRTEASFSMILSVISQLVTILTGLVLQRYILVAFGSSYNGLTSLVSQIISYLVLLESGIGAASTQALYHPMNTEHWYEINGVINATAKSYRQVGYMFSALLAGAALIVPLMAVGEVDFVIAALITLISGGSNIISYMISAKYGILLMADCKMHVRHILSIIFVILSGGLRIIALHYGCGIVFVQFLHLLCSFFKAIALWVYARRHYPKLDRSVPPNMQAIRKRWNVLVHILAGLVVNHTDVMILSIADTLKQVSLYNVYNQLYVYVGQFLHNAFQHSLQGNFGRLLDSNKREFEQTYAVYETLYTVVLFIVATLTVLLTRPFITLYTSDVTDVQYIDFWLPILFISVFLFNNVRIPALVTINAAGMFKETQPGAIIEMILNLSVSLILFFFTDLGIYGLLLGTIASFLFRTIDVLLFVYRHILERSGWLMLRLLFINTATFLTFVILLYVWKPIHVSSAIEWFICAILLGIIAVAVFLVVNLLFNYHDTKNTLKFVKMKFFKK